MSQYISVKMMFVLYFIIFSYVKDEICENITIYCQYYDTHCNQGRPLFWLRNSIYYYYWLFGCWRSNEDVESCWGLRCFLPFWWRLRVPRFGRWRQWLQWYVFAASAASLLVFWQAIKDVRGHYNVYYI